MMTGTPTRNQTRPPKNPPRNNSSGHLLVVALLNRMAAARTRLILVLTVGAALAAFGQAPEPSQPARVDSTFQELPDLRAIDILKPEMLKGPSHSAREPVPTSS